MTTEEETKSAPAPAPSTKGDDKKQVVLGPDGKPLSKNALKKLAKGKVCLSS